MFGAPPNCRPECVIHQDCPSNRACIRQRCEDPCAGACGFNALCTAQNHKPVCSCLEGYEGDPYAGCNTPQSEYLFQIYSFFLLLGNRTNSKASCSLMPMASSILILYIYFSLHL